MTDAPTKPYKPPRFADLVEFDEGSGVLLIDGKPFPWYLTEQGVTITATPGGKTLTLEIPIRRVVYRR